MSNEDLKKRLPLGSMAGAVAAGYLLFYWWVGQHGQGQGARKSLAG